ncbi:hypothetical protein E3U43_019981, partial [Larimichthys crocea]
MRINMVQKIKEGGTVPARRRGRSATKTEPVCQTSAKVVVDDQKTKESKSADQFDTVKESGTVEPKMNAKKLKHKEIVTEQSSEVNVIRRSNRATLSKRLSDGAAESESLSKSDAILTESKPDVSVTAEAKPARSDRRRQSKRLNKDATEPENLGPLSTETDNLTSPSSDSLKNEETRVPSLKLKKIRNPKYDARASGKNPEKGRRKKKVKKFVWTLTLEKGGSPIQGAENTVKVTEKTVS